MFSQTVQGKAGDTEPEDGIHEDSLGVSDRLAVEGWSRDDNAMCVTEQKKRDTNHGWVIRRPFREIYEERRTVIMRANQHH